MRKAVLFAGAMALAIGGPLVVHARGLHRGGTYWGPTCPLGVTYNDGCKAAISTAMYQNSSLYSTNPVSGQTEAYTPPWNMPGVNYPVGYDTANPPTTDPSTLTTGGCVYTAPGATAGAKVVCNGGGTSATTTFTGIDFSLHGCTPITIGNYVGTVQFINNKFKNGWGCGTTGYLLQFNAKGQGPNVVFTDNEVDGQEASNVVGSIASGVLTITSLTGSFNIGDVFDAPGTSGVYHVIIQAVNSGTPCAVNNVSNCGVGSYNVSWSQAYPGASIKAGALTTVVMPSSGNAINGIQYGQTITDSNGVIPGGTTVAGVPGVAVTLSQAATGVTTNDTITVTAPSMNLSFTGGRVASITWKNGVFSGFGTVLNYSNWGNWFIERNYFHNIPDRPFSGFFNGAGVFRHNVCTSIGEDASFSTAHGECFDVVSSSAAAGISILGYWDVGFNTFVQLGIPVGLYSAWIYAGNMGEAQPQLWVHHNVLLGNCMIVSGSVHCSYQGQNPGGGANGNGLLGLARNPMALDADHNYIDPTGYFRCAYNAALVTAVAGTVTNGVLSQTSTGDNTSSMAGGAILADNVPLGSATGLTASKVTGYVYTGASPKATANLASGQVSASSGGGNWAFFPPLTFVMGGVYGNVNMLDGTTALEQTPYLNGVCNQTITTP